jgi:hypothetical protein
MLKGETFKKIVLSLHPSNEAAVDLLNKHAGQALKASDMQLPTPRGEEEACAGPCGGLKQPHELLHGQCIACWYDTVKRLRGEAN